ncbi:hypothetical protein UFOVP2_45 [uncultured Caudovirales phage]|uniref:Uncharacterized protein n=1 Tax=uncultured Caudovirales phage TaxID=2100421 RepID=A0A6J5KIA3_9CAUD|nr:hypothetical protein UFOVP2_45 [uncultured Caudovirales phage]
MANPFDITPADPLQTQNDWRNSLAQTAYNQSAARQGQQREQLNQMAIQKGQQQQAEDNMFKESLKKLSPDIAPEKQLGEIARLAMLSGSDSRAEKALALQSQIISRTSQIEQRDALKEYREAQAAGIRIQRQKDLIPQMTSELGLEAANMSYKAEFGEDLPFVKAMRAKGISWSPAVKASIESMLEKHTTKVQEDATRTRTKLAENREARAATAADTRQTLLELKIEQLKTTIAAGGKSGGGKLVNLQKGDERLTSIEIKKLFPALEGKELEYATLKIGNSAKQQQIKDSGSFSDALDKVMPQHMGEFKTTEGGLFTRPAATFTPTKKPAAAASAPSKSMPAGSVHVGMTPQGQKVFKAPDGKQYVED